MRGSGSLALKQRYQQRGIENWDAESYETGLERDAKRTYAPRVAIRGRSGHRSAKSSHIWNLAVYNYLVNDFQRSPVFSQRNCLGV